MRYFDVIWYWDIFTKCSWGAVPSSGWRVMVGLSETKGEEGGNYDHNRQFSRKKKKKIKRSSSNVKISCRVCCTTVQPRSLLRPPLIYLTSLHCLFNRSPKCAFNFIEIWKQQQIGGFSSNLKLLHSGNLGSGCTWSSCSLGGGGEMRIDWAVSKTLQMFLKKFST